MAYQKDISAILGLSIATVSKALKGYPDVSEDTRRKVLQTAEEIDYNCSRIGGRGGAGFAPKKAGAIGILVTGCESEVRESLFCRRAICGIIEEAARRNVDAVIMTADTKSRSMSCIGKITARKLDGVCLMLSRKEIYNGRFVELFESGVPMVSVEQEAAGVISVCSDKRGNVRMLLNYLKDRGHRNLAYLGDLSLDSKRNAVMLREEAEKLDMSCIEDKYRGRGIRDRFGTQNAGCEGAEGDADCDAAKTDADTADRITCLIVRTQQEADERAAEWLELGIRVPNGISIAVLEAGASESAGKFSGIDRSPEYIGRTAAAKLMEIIEYPERDTGENLVLAGEIAECGTVLDLSGINTRKS